jgi:hypothetical protein
MKLTIYKLDSNPFTSSGKLNINANIKPILINNLSLEEKIKRRRNEILEARKKKNLGIKPKVSYAIF